MNTDFNRAMRAAVQLTRNGRLMDATRVILKRVVEAW